VSTFVICHQKKIKSGVHELTYLTLLQLGFVSVRGFVELCTLCGC